jgi:hypothetical protein
LYRHGTKLITLEGNLAVKSKKQVKTATPVAPAVKASNGDTHGSKLPRAGRIAKVKAIVAPAAPKTEAPVDRRITVGARIDTWRVVPSQRKEHPGYWLQGGHFEAQGDRQMFRVAEQALFSDLAAAKAALAVKQPAKAA